MQGTEAVGEEGTAWLEGEGVAPRLSRPEEVAVDDGIRIHGLQRDQAQGVIEQVLEDKDEQDKTGQEPGPDSQIASIHQRWHSGGQSDESDNRYWRPPGLA